MTRGLAAALVVVAACMRHGAGEQRAREAGSGDAGAAAGGEGEGGAQASLSRLAWDASREPSVSNGLPIVAMPVEGAPEAVISLPLGAVAPKPIVVATHGAWDAPEGLCDDQRWIFHDTAWVVCPRGRPMPDKTFRYDSSVSVAREIDADLRALAARYPGYVDASSVLYTGFSLGAILGVGVITSDPERYPRAVLIEGGEDKWSPALAAKYARAGGKRVLFACGLRGRVPAAQQAAAMLERAGVEAHVVLGKLPDAGQFAHWYNGPIAEETRAQLPWLLEGDARWETAATTN